MSDVDERMAARSFGEWSRSTRSGGRLPWIVIAGSVGKSTVARLIDEVAQQSGLRTALRVDRSAEILGRRRGDRPATWQDAMRRLGEGSLDLAIQEVHWSELPSLVAEAPRIGLLVVSTVCPDREVCRLDETRAAISTLRSLIASLPPTVTSIVDADDIAATLLSEIDSRTVSPAALRPEQPSFRRFFDEGGLGAWITDGQLTIGRGSAKFVMGNTATFPITLDGSSSFQLHNLMAATLACVEMGFSPNTVAEVLRSYGPTHTRFPGSLHVVRTAHTRVLVDRPSPSWFLAPLLRTLRSLRPSRLTCVVDYPSTHEADDLVDIGRMVARQAHAVIMIDGEVGLAGVLGLRAGIAQTPHPPPIIHAASLPRAIQRAISGAQEDEVTLVLSSRPELVHRILARERVSDAA